MNLRRAGIMMLAVLTGCSPPCPKSAESAKDAETEKPEGSAESDDDGDDGEAESVIGDSQGLAAKIAPLRKGGRKKVRYIPPSNAEERAFHEWVKAAAFAASEGAKLPGSIPDGFRVEEIPGSSPLWLVAELQDRRRGAGALILRAGNARPLIVEAPHTFFDQGTLPIAIDLFEQQGCRALLINTVHRYSVELRARDAGKDEHDDDDGEEGTRRASPSDVAHTDDSYFQSAHRALTAAHPGTTTIQLHGFNGKSAPEVDVIVSGAGTSADPEPVVQALRKAFPEITVRAYPKDIRKLGGETNVQAKWSSREGTPFLHIEISRALRDRLVDDFERRRRFAEALSTAAPRPQPNP